MTKEKTRTNRINLDVIKCSHIDIYKRKPAEIVFCCEKSSYVKSNRPGLRSSHLRCSAETFFKNFSGTSHAVTS